MDLYDADNEDEVTPSWKRQKTAPADGDTRVVVEYRCDSPPAAQEIPGEPLYQSLSESESDDDGVIIRTPPHYYDVFPDETVVVTPDGGHIRIPDQHTITHPKPSTSTIEDDADHDDDDDEDEPADDSRKVCFIKMQTNIARLIAHQWRISAPSTVEEVTVDVCRSLAVTVLSAAYQDILMKYVRCAIRRQP